METLIFPPIPEKTVARAVIDSGMRSERVTD